MIEDSRARADINDEKDEADEEQVALGLGIHPGLADVIPAIVEIGPRKFGIWKIGLVVIAENSVGVGIGILGHSHGAGVDQEGNCVDPERGLLEAIMRFYRHLRV